MKLSEAQKNNVCSLLSYVLEHDLISLGRTITSNLIPIETGNDALQAIIQHETNPRSLLSRRKVTKEVLFKYLHANMIDIPSNSEKSVLAFKILEFWKCDLLKESVTRDGIDTKDDTSPNDHVGDVTLLAEKFVTWFYSLLNEFVRTEQSETLSIEHFWNDCSLRLIMESSSESVVEDVCKNATDVVSLLRNTLIQHKLYFNPNISQYGVQGQVDCHGLVMVMACGTLHQVDTCVGIFRQIFGLLRDPFMENNWRIKSSCVLLKSMENSSVPIIEQDHYNILALPE